MPNTTQRNIEIDITTRTRKAEEDIKRLNKQINQLSKQNAGLQKTTKQVQQMSRSFASLATHLGRLALIYGTFQGLQATVRTFGEFEQSIKRLGVISGATEGELAQLEQRAKDLGESTIFTASQVAEGMNAMAMAGLSAGEQLSGIGSVLNTATIGMITLEEASLITVRAMNAFGLEAQDMSTISDVLATGATNSAQTVTELGNAYEKVGAVATAFGVSITETTTALEIMADAGRVGSEAGTQLKIVLSRLAGNKEAKKYIDALGISMYDANGKLLPFKEQLVLLKGELGKLDEQARNIKLGEIFGEEGKASAIILMNNLDKYDKKLKQLNNSYGVSAVKAKELQDTLLGAWKELQSALEGLAIKIGANLTPKLRGVIEDATEFIQTLDQGEIDNFTDSIINLGEGLATVGDLIFTILKPVSEVAGSFEEATGASAGWIVVLGALIIKLKKFKTELSAMSLVAKTSTAIILSAVAVYTDMADSLDDYQTAIHRTSKALQDHNKHIATFINGYEELDLTQTNKELEGVTKNLESLERRFASNEKLIKEYESSWNFLDDATKLYAMSLKRANEEIATSIQTDKFYQEELKKHGNALTALRRQIIKDAEDAKKAETELGDERKKLSDEHLKDLEKIEKKLEARQVSLEKGLGNMYAKERKYAQALQALETAKAQMRRGYAIQREQLELSLSARISAIQLGTLNNFEKYQAQQKRSEKLLHDAKIAYQKGNLEVAKTLLKEYDTLISASAGQEVTVNKRTYLTKKTTADEFVKDAKAGHQVMLDIIRAEEQKEIEASNKKIKAKQAERELNLEAIRLQKEILVLIGKMIAQANGVVFDPDFTRFDKALTNAETEISAMTEKQRLLKINGDTSGLKKNIDDGVRDLKATVDVKANTKPAVIEMSAFKKDIEGSDTSMRVNLSTDVLYQELDGIIMRVSEPVQKPTGLETDQAYRDDANLVRQVSKPAYKTVYVNYVPTNGYQVGGLVHAPSLLPRFANGGDLDSGIGHSRKTGKLSGYGGGDKIKALLEKGEFIIRKEAVRALGIARLNTINQGRLPRFQTGGPVTPKLPRFAGGGVVNKKSSGGTVDLNINMGGQTFKAQTETEVANALAEYLQRNEF